MVSIITVCFNSEKTIERTIKSVLNQSDRCCEHIFIDGKSEDATACIIEGYRNQYAIVGIPMTLISEADKGYYDAMNKGIAIAKGNRIGILNSDDAYDKDTVSCINQIDSVARKSRKNIDIIMGAIRIHNGDQILIKKAKRAKHYQTSRHFNHPAMFVTPECYRKIGGYRVGNVHNDYRWFLKAIKHGVSVEVTDYVLADFYTGGESAPKKLSDVNRRIKSKYEIYQKEGYSPLYLLECVGMETMKYFLISKN